jgi:hypothetical protein
MIKSEEFLLTSLENVLQRQIAKCRILGRKILGCPDVEQGNSHVQIQHFTVVRTQSIATKNCLWGNFGVSECLQLSRMLAEQTQALGMLVDSFASCPLLCVSLDLISCIRFEKTAMIPTATNRNNITSINRRLHVQSHVTTETALIT